MQNNDDVTTPDRGDGIILGRGVGGKLIVRLRVQQPFTEAERVQTFKGWQYSYDEADLKMAEAKKGKR